MRRANHHNEFELNLLPSGHITYLFGSRRVRVEAGRLTVFWAAIPHQVIEVEGTTEYYVATIPFASFLQYRLPERLTQSLLAGAVQSAEEPARRSDLDLFAQWECDLRNPTAETGEIVALEMKARLMRMATALPPAQADHRAHRRHRSVLEGGLNKIEEMALILARRYTEPLTADEIGREVRLHPDFAMNLFREAFGTTLHDCLTRHRISHAQRLLATGSDKIVDVALASGFNSISRFNEAFRCACGCSPSDYRRQTAAP